MMLGRLVLRRAGLLGALSYAGANFLVTFIVQLRAPAAEFGLYAIGLVAVLFGTSLSNALFASPIVVAFVRDPERQAETIQSFFAANLIYCAVMGVVILVSMVGLGATLELGGLITVQAVLLWMRWFFRAVDLAAKNYLAPALADGAHGLVVITLGAVFFYGDRVITVREVAIAMAAGAVVSGLILGPATVRALRTTQFDAFRRFIQSLKAHGGWALVGVLTTEITANLHSYVVAVFLGPAAFAPISAVGLFMRPVAVVSQATVQFERPRIAEYIHQLEMARVKHDIGKVNSGLIAFGLLNFVMLATLVAIAPHLIGGGQYTNMLLWPVAFLIAVMEIGRAASIGSSLALQAAGRFRVLAVVTLITAPISALAVFVVMSWLHQGILAILAVAAAVELARCILTVEAYRRLLCIGGTSRLST